MHARRATRITAAVVRFVTPIVFVLLLLGLSPAAQAAPARWLEFPDKSRIEVITALWGAKVGASQSWDVSKLGKRAGFLEGTAPPGGGNTVIGAHNPGPFTRLLNLKANDLLSLQWNGSLHVYQVQAIAVITVDQVQVTFDPPDEFSYLTLLTCDGDQRLMVRAVEVVIK